MNTWLIIVGMGLITFGLRLAPWLLLEGRGLPPGLGRALRYVGPSVLAAIIATEILWPGGAPAFTPANPRLWGGLAASVAAWRTHSVFWTLVAGMATFWLLQALL